MHHKAQAETLRSCGPDGREEEEREIVCIENQSSPRRTKHPNVPEAQSEFQETSCFLTQNSGSALPVRAGSPALPQRTVTHMLPPGVFVTRRCLK